MRRSDETSWLNGLTNAPAKKDRSKKCSGGSPLIPSPPSLRLPVLQFSRRTLEPNLLFVERHALLGPEISDYLNWLKILQGNFCIYNSWGAVCSPVQSGRPDHSSRHFVYAITRDHSSPFALTVNSNPFVMRMGQTLGYACLSILRW